jgi:hypothetical protein
VKALDYSEVRETCATGDAILLEEFKYLFSFDGSDTALAAGKRSWDRLELRTAEPVEPPVPVPSI